MQYNFFPSFPECEKSYIICLSWNMMFCSNDKQVSLFQASNYLDAMKEVGKYYLNPKNSLKLPEIY